METNFCLAVSSLLGGALVLSDGIEGGYLEGELRLGAVGKESVYSFR